MIISLSLAKGSVSLNKEPKLIVVKQLDSAEKLLVILDTGLYLYEQDSGRKDNEFARTFCRNS